MSREFDVPLQLYICYVNMDKSNFFEGNHWLNLIRYTKDFVCLWNLLLPVFSTKWSFFIIFICNLFSPCRTQIISISLSSMPFWLVREWFRSFSRLVKREDADQGWGEEVSCKERVLWQRVVLSEEEWQRAVHRRTCCSAPSGSIPTLHQPSSLCPSRRLPS